MRRMFKAQSLWNALRPVLKGLFAESAPRTPSPAGRMEPLEARQLLSGPPFVNATVNDIVYDSQGNLHLVYYKSDTGDLYYAKRSSTGEWVNEQRLAGDGQVGGADVGSHLSIAVNGTRPAVAYYDAVNGDLKYMYFDGVAWQGPESADADNASLNVGYYPSLIFNNATPILSYCNWTNKNLRVSRRVNGVWQKVHEEANANDTGRWTSIGIGSNGRWCVTSATKTTDNVAKLVFTQSVDSSNVVATDLHALGNTTTVQSVSMAFDSANNPGVSYYDSQAADLWYVKATGSTWGTPEQVDSEGTQGQYSNLFFNGTDPLIAYKSQAAGPVDQAKLASKSGSAWTTSTMLSGGGSTLSAARASDGTVTFTNLRTGDSGLRVDDFQNGLLAPTGVTANARANVPVIDLHWDYDGGNQQGFIIERSTDGVNWTEVFRPAASDRSYTDWGDEKDVTIIAPENNQPRQQKAYWPLGVSTTYRYRVRAFAGSNESANSGRGSDVTGSFRLFDATWYQNAPVLPKMGMTDIRTTGIDFWAGSYPWSDMINADESACRRLARNLEETHEVLCIDIEPMANNEWLQDIRDPNNHRIIEEWRKEKVNESIKKFTQLIEWIRDEDMKDGIADVKLGLWATMPLTGSYEYMYGHYDPATGQNVCDYPEGTPEYTQYMNWAGENGANAYYRQSHMYEGVNLAPLADKVDYIFPCLYTRWSPYEPSADPNYLSKWGTYADQLIAEAKKYGKPVVPYIWTNFSRRGLNPQTGQYEGYQFLSQSDWAFMLDKVRDSGADGAAIWSGERRDPATGALLGNYAWPGSAGWWDATQAFLSET